MNKLKPGSGIYKTRGCGVLFGLFFISAAAPGLIISVMDLMGNPESHWFTSGISTLCTALFVVIGFVIIVNSVIPWIAEWRIGKPEVSISGNSVGVGDGFSVNYSQIFRQKTDLKGIKVTLIKRERATYSSGTSSTTVTHEEPAGEFDYPARTYEAGEQLAFSRRMEIPRDGMHTFKAKNNEITWLLQVKVDIDGWPDYREYFEISVAPFMGG